MNDLLRGLDPYNRSTYPDPGGSSSPYDLETLDDPAVEAADNAIRLQELLRGCYDQGLMLLRFLDALTTKHDSIQTTLTREEALDIAGKVWRAS